MKRIERNVVERAYNINKRYEKLSGVLSSCKACDLDKWIDMQHKRYEMTKNALERNMQYFDSQVVHRVIDAVVKNGRPKDALMDALHLIGYELY